MTASLDNVDTIDKPMLIKSDVSSLSEAGTSARERKAVNALKDCNVVIRALPLSSLQDAKAAKFSCNICSFRCNSFKRLVNHSSSHDLPDNTAIDKEETDSSINQKLYENIPVNSYSCSLCTFSSLDSKKLQKHHDSKHRKGNFYCCSKCNFKCINIYALKIHFRKHSHEQPFYCMYCPRRFRNFVSIMTHEKRHSNECCYKCSECHYMTTKAVEYTEHTLCYHPEGNAPYECPKCGSYFNDKSMYVVHMESHLPQNEKFRCPHCSLVFGNRIIFFTHYFSYHKQAQRHLIGKGSVEKGKKDVSDVIEPPPQEVLLFKAEKKTRPKYKLICNKCNFSASSAVSLYKHKSRHHTAFQCPHCPYLTVYKSNLSKHISIHLRNDKKSNMKANISAKKEFPSHQSAHRLSLPSKPTDSSTSKKKHTCSFCSFKSNSLIGYKIHVSKKHSNDLKLSPNSNDCTKQEETEKKLSCHLCDRKCLSESQFAIHMMRHKSNHRHKCHICTYSVAKQKALHYHLRRDHLTSQAIKFDSKRDETPQPVTSEQMMDVDKTETSQLIDSSEMVKNDEIETSQPIDSSEMMKIDDTETSQPIDSSEMMNIDDTETSQPIDSSEMMNIDDTETSQPIDSSEMNIDDTEASQAIISEGINEIDNTEAKQPVMFEVKTENGSAETSKLLIYEGIAEVGETETSQPIISEVKSEIDNAESSLPVIFEEIMENTDARPLSDAINGSTLNIPSVISGERVGNDQTVEQSFDDKISGKKVGDILSNVLQTPNYDQKEKVLATEGQIVLPEQHTDEKPSQEDETSLRNFRIDKLHFKK